MRRIALVLVLALFAAAATAQNVTQSVLEAKPVRKFIRVQLLPNPDPATVAKTPKILQYAVDSYLVDDMKPFGNDFRVPDSALLLLAEHNPLLEVYDITLTLRPDPNHEALKAFFEQLEGLKAVLPAAPEVPGGGQETAAQRAERVEKRVNEKCKTLTAAALTTCRAAELANIENEEACALLTRLMNEALTALHAVELEPKDFNDSVNAASGLTGVESFRTVIKTARDQIIDNNKTARAKLKEIADTFGSKPGGTPSKTCNQINSIMLINYTELQTRAEALMARKEQLAAELAKLHKSLDRHADKDNWRGATSTARTDYIARSLAPTIEKEANVVISLKTNTLTFDPTKGTITTETSKDAVGSAEFVVRRDSYFTIERAVAAVYNTLEYPQYGTGLKDGATVVVRTEDHKPIDAAIMFNFIPRLGSISGVYPMFQMGFSSAKDFPGLLAGVGVRIVGRFPVSLSAGGLITRYKDLDGKLREGSPVSGTAEIDEHLVLKTSPVALYGAIQLKF